MIKSKYIADAKVPEFDPAINEALDEITDGGGNEMVIAIENFEGQIYRVVNTIGLGAYMNAVSALAELGLRDTLADSISAKNGYDSWFIVTDEVTSPHQKTQQQAPDTIAELLSEMDSIPETEREAVLKCRVGQGVFREQLIDYWKSCAVTGADCIPLLRASHIKPWRNSSNDERLDKFNGLLLTPNLDAAFDAGYISFNSNGKILLSSKIGGAPAFQLHISHKFKINSKLLTDKHQVYLQHHREKVFLG